MDVPYRAGWTIVALANSRRPPGDGNGMEIGAGRGGCWRVTLDELVLQLRYNKTEGGK